jgi:hypothetical protein
VTYTPNTMGFWRMFRYGHNTWLLGNPYATPSLWTELVYLNAGSLRSGGTANQQEDTGPCLFLYQKKKPYGSHWACLCVSEIEKMRDGNSAVLGRRAVYSTRRWREEFVWVTIFLAILVNFNISTAESCFHWQRAGPHGHILIYRKKMCTNVHCLQLS